MSLPPDNFLLILLAVCLLLLIGLGLSWLGLRRRLSALDDLAAQLQRIAVGGALRGRVEVASDHPQLAPLHTAINHLLARATTAPPAPAAPAPSAPLALLGDRVHEAVILHGAQGILYANAHFAALMGVAQQELRNRALGDLLPPEYAELVGDNIRRRLAGEPGAERYEVELLGLQGQSARLELSSSVVEHEGKPALLIVGVEILPTQSLLTLPAVSSGRSRTRAALEALPEAVVMVDTRARVEYINPAALRLLGLEGERARHEPLAAALAGLGVEERKLLLDPLTQALSAGAPVNLGRRAIVITPLGGNERLVEISAAPIRDETSEVSGAVLLLHDVTEQRGLTRQISYQATHDALTGLVNRREFEHRLQESIDIARRGDGVHALCYIDLDRFKVINDTSGHLAGDSMLRDVARLLREAVRDSDTVARLGGDEFGLLLSGCPLDKARQIADDVCRKIGDFRFVWKDKIFNVGASIGIVEISRDSGAMEEVLAAADSACYVAKRQGGHVAVYSAKDEALARHSGEIHWLQLLQSALKENRFELYSQPIVAAFGGDTDGPMGEVLVRLKDEQGVTIAPAEFIKAAERYRLMGTLDRRIVQQTLAALGSGALHVPEGRSIALNVSGQTLADGQFLEFVVDCFDSTGADPAQVCFEIAESAVIGNLDQAQRFIGVLHGMGCRFALDDFGSGMGSFSNLKNLAVDYLKIDGSFTRNLARDSVTQTMVSAMIKLARTMNFKVIAEQVEDEAAANAARRAGVDYLQGYAIARPAPMSLKLAA